MVGQELCTAQQAEAIMSLPALQSNLLDRAVTALTWCVVLVATAIALSVHVADPDLWGHVQYGQDLLRDGLPSTTTYSYTAQGYRWINHELLAEIALAAAANLGGGLGLMLLKTTLGLVIMGLLLARSLRQKHDFLSTTIPLLLVAATLGNYFCLRPQLGSYLFFTLELALLEWCFAGWGNSCAIQVGSDVDKSTATHSPLGYKRSRLKYLWLGPVIFCLWTNTHGGFLAGLAVWIAYLSLRSVEAWLRLGRASDGLILRLGMLMIGSLLVTILNPYGMEFLTWLFDDLKVPRPEIVEWRAPNWNDLTNVPFGILIGLTFVSLFSSRSKDYTRITVLGLILWQALSHDRHVAFFALACGFWLPTWLQAAKERVLGAAPAEAPPTRFQQLALAGGLLLALVPMGMHLQQKVATVQVENDVYPVAAVQFVKNQQLSGRMVVAFNWAQYAIAAWGQPDAAGNKIEVDIDGRCRTAYSQAMLDHHLDFLLGEVPASERYRGPESGPFIPELVLEQGSPNLVLISRGQPHAVQVMEAQKGTWTLLYQDSIAQLWGIADRYDAPHSHQYLPAANRLISDARQSGTTPWPAFAKEHSSSVTQPKTFATHFSTP